MKRYFTGPFKKHLPWLLGLALIWAAFSLMLVEQPANGVHLAYSELLGKVRSGEIKKVVIQGDSARSVDKRGTLYSTHVPGQGESLVTELVNANVTVDSKPVEPPSMLFSLFLAWGPTLLLVGVGVYAMRQRAQAGPGNQGGQGGMFSFGKSRAKLLDQSKAVTTFADVAGCDEAKEEVTELVEFLKDPQKFESLGGKIPRGVLLAGPPGTGKTLLARAIAGEAKVPFFSISGSDFVEMFVGVGAARVRDLFEQAKKSAPCIIFIDEIDAVGRQRGGGSGGGSDEREQTLNQMLVEMDGFEAGLGVIVVAATNRPDILDSALLRPGRFDRQVMVSLPDVRGREQIMAVHLRKVPVGADVNPSVIARGTPGFSGAELANLVNEAALFAARASKRLIGMEEVEKAKDKILMGPEKKSMRMSEDERSDTAYHEAGHAVIAKLLKNTDPVHKVSIVPRGRALGVTLQLPEGDRYSLSKNRILDTIAVLFGGRVAEELFTGDITTGASNDYERATSLARNMVTRWGMSDVIGPMVVSDSENEAVFSGRGTRSEGGSPFTMQKVDEEVRRILDTEYARAKRLLLENEPQMHSMRNALMKWETLDALQVEDIMNGCEPRPPKTYTGHAPVTAPFRPGPQFTGNDAPAVDLAPAAV